MDEYLQNKIFLFNVHPLAELLKPYIESYYKGQIFVGKNRDTGNFRLCIICPAKRKEHFSFTFFYRQYEYILHKRYKENITDNNIRSKYFENKMGNYNVYRRFDLTYKPLLVFGGVSPPHDN